MQHKTLKSHALFALLLAAILAMPLVGIFAHGHTPGTVTTTAAKSTAMRTIQPSGKTGKGMRSQCPFSNACGPHQPEALQGTLNEAN